MVIIVGLRAQHAIIRDENVPNKALNNVDVALNLNADDASKNDGIDKVRGIFPANHGILKDAGTVTRRRTYKEVLKVGCPPVTTLRGFFLIVCKRTYN